MRGWALRIFEWLEYRLGVKDFVVHSATHPVPPGTNWWYVFGSASMTLLGIQIVTGILLATVYIPAADKAYESLLYLNYEQYLGWFIRALHFWAASGMVVMVVLHMTQVFLTGAYKYPRELTWCIGVGLFGLTLAMGFTGQVLRWDGDAYWGIGVGASMAGRVPLLGPAIVQLLLGGPMIGGETLSRFFTLHVFVLPGLLFSLLGVHLYLVLKQGVSSMPVAGKPVDPATYEAEYAKDVAVGEPFFPDPIYKDAIFSCGVVIAVVLLAASLGPYGPGEPPDPTLIDANPRPEWYFLPLFAILSLSPPEWETFIMLVFPAVIFGVLLAVPFVSGKGERSPARRPIGVVSVIIIYFMTITLGFLGHAAPWSPQMQAWSGLSVPPRMVDNLAPAELQGAAVFQNKQCRNCHALDGKGGLRGPDLTDVATKLTFDELVTQVELGGGNMPAFGKSLSPPEVDALCKFLQTLRPKGQPPAKSPVDLASP